MRTITIELTENEAAHIARECADRIGVISARVSPPKGMTLGETIETLGALAKLVEQITGVVIGERVATGDDPFEDGFKSP